MYLSKIFLSWGIAQNSYEIHRSLWKLFHRQSEKGRSFLFRVEKQLLRKGIELLMQSEDAPDKTEGNIHVFGCKEFNPKIVQGDVLHFRLYANPVKTIKDKDGRKNGKDEVKTCRVPLVSIDEQIKWVGKKFEDFAEIESLTVNGLPPIFFYKQSEKRRGKIQPVLFDGVVSVKDPALLTKNLKEGIGPAKAFGCGLLSLKRA